jgi:Novel STAND NTPase 1/WD domain, G-beta repeat
VTEVATRSSESPYKGLARYEEEDAPYFFGRDADAELVVANLLAARLTLLFGESGVGKSSLLHAGVAPRLRGADDLVLVLFSDWRGDAASSLAAALREASGLDAGPVDLVSTIATCAAHSGRDLVVVLDQFEEYFVYHPDEDVEDTFALEFPRAVTQADLPVTFLIAIREDALARLERFKGRIPGLFETYLRLDRLDRDAAREAIVAPLKRHAAVYPDDAVSADPVLVEQVLDEVEVGRFAFGNTGAGSLDGAGTASGPGSRPIEAPYLQLVLSRLWDEERRAGSRQLRLETLERLGGAERIVRTHLDDALNALSADEQELAASVFRYLVTPSGTKIAHRIDDLAEYAGAPPAAVASVLGKLAAGSTRVVRPAGEDAYEIYHDVLAGAVLDWRARYLHDRELAAAEGRRRLRSRLVLAALVLAIVAGAAAGITIWRVQAGHTDDAKRREQAQALELALAVPFTRAIFTGHREPLQSVAFSPDGRRVASAGQGGDVRIWDWNPTTGRGTEIAALHPGGEVLQATFDPSGELLATAGTTGEAIVWRWESGERLAHVEEPFGLDGAAWDPRGRLLALPGDDGTVRLWNWRTGRVDPILDAQSGVARSAAFSRDGRLLVVGSDDGTARVWDLAEERILATLPTHGNTVYAAVFSPDGRFVATGGQDGRARVWDWRARKVVWSKRAVDYYVESLAFNPGGTILAVANGGGTARLWDWRHDRQVAALREGGDQSVAFNQNGCLVATASYDSTARIWAPPLDGCPR